MININRDTAWWLNDRGWHIPSQRHAIDIERWSENRVNAFILLLADFFDSVELDYTILKNAIERAQELSYYSYSRSNQINKDYKKIYIYLYNYCIRFNLLPKKEQRFFEASYVKSIQNLEVMLYNFANTTKFRTIKDYEEFRILRKKILLNTVNISSYFQFIPTKVVNVQNLKHYIKIDNYSNSCFYFRGQNNSKWKLIPSLYRQSKEITDLIFCKNHIITSSDLCDYYKHLGLYKKYEENISKIHRENFYQFVSFIQHASSLSPFLDFSNDVRIATMFALSDFEDKEFLNHDAAIFMIYVNQKKAKKGKTFFNDFIANVISNSKELEYRELLNIIGYNTEFDFNTSFPNNNYEIYINRSNDKMKNQKGIFLLLNSAYLTNNHIGYFDINIIKYVISGKLKFEIYKYLTESEIHLSYQSILDPYSNFVINK